MRSITCFILLRINKVHYLNRSFYLYNPHEENIQKVNIGFVLALVLLGCPCYSTLHGLKPVILVVFVGVC